MGEEASAAPQPPDSRNAGTGVSLRLQVAADSCTVPPCWPAAALLLFSSASALPHPHQRNSSAAAGPVRCEEQRPCTCECLRWIWGVGLLPSQLLGLAKRGGGGGGFQGNSGETRERKHNTQVFFQHLQPFTGWSTTRKFEFGQKCCRWVNLWRSTPQASVRTKNLTSDYWTVFRGTRQGVPPTAPLV